MQFLDELNDEQRWAVEAPDGPVMIVAGPGTGKTKTLVARVAYVVLTGRAQPNELLVLTFTNKAAAEVRGRLAGLLGTDHGVRVGTFHSVALVLLGDDERGFLTEAERLEVIRGLVKPVALRDLSTRELALRLTRFQNSSQSDDPVLMQLAHEYNQAVTALGKRDFDSLLVAADQWLAAGRVTPWRHLLIDEFQDTSDIQYTIARRLTTDGQVFAIGDPRQSIYGFRGAGEAMFERLAADYPEVTRVVLQTNYRSGKAIVAAANAVFRAGHLAEPLAAWRPATGQVRAVETLSEWSEAEYVGTQIDQALGGVTMHGTTAEHNGEYTPRDLAVLYRTHRAAQAMIRRLAASGIPYQVAGGDAPYGAPSLRLVVAGLQRLARAGGAAMESGMAQPGRSELAGASTAELEQLVRGLADHHPSQAVAELGRRLKLSTEDDQLALAALAGALVQFDAAAEPFPAAAQYLETLTAGEFYDPRAEAVTLMTIHAAKGLEFPVVFVLGANEGWLPHLRADGRHDVDEEQRLFYVAATRAQERLELVWSRSRGGKPVERSRFLDGLPVEHLVDPDLARGQRRRAIGRAKRAQGSLF